MKGYLIYTFLWCFYFPFIIVLKCLLFWHPKVRQRYEFEARNGKDLGSHSWQEMGIKADYCFEFSSEGEFQQVASLIYDALKLEKRIELVFFSPSVEKSILDLAQNFSTQIRYLRYPFLGMDFSSWVTSDQLILVRYDFFPELLAYSLLPGKKLKLLWITFKRERLKAKSPSLLKKLFLYNASSIIYASKDDQLFGQQLGMVGEFYDFRMEQINRRVLDRERKLTKLMQYKHSYELLIKSYPFEKRLILGNAWPVDMDLLKDLPSNILLFVVPHQLTSEILELITKKLRECGREPSVITHESTDLAGGDTFVINQKGILCELYSDFGFAYVGGGLGVSVHSILEPLVAGSSLISCGPNHLRSTEFDMAHDFQRMTEVTTNADFLRWLSLNAPTGPHHVKLQEQINLYAYYRKGVLEC